MTCRPYHCGRGGPLTTTGGDVRRPPSVPAGGHPEPVMTAEMVGDDPCQPRGVVRCQLSLTATTMRGTAPQCQPPPPTGVILLVHTHVYHPAPLVNTLALSQAGLHTIHCMKGHYTSQWLTETFIIVCIDARLAAAGHASHTWKPSPPPSQ